MTDYLSGRLSFTYTGWCCNRMKSQMIFKRFKQCVGNFPFIFRLDADIITNQWIQTFLLGYSRIIRCWVFQKLKIKFVKCPKIAFLFGHFKTGTGNVKTKDKIFKSHSMQWESRWSFRYRKNSAGKRKLRCMSLTSRGLEGKWYKNDSEVQDFYKNSNFPALITTLRQIPNFSYIIFSLVY